jgi:5'-methylthioadenosine phosphorylase
MVKGKIGIIGGSGLYNIEGIQDVGSVKVSTPFGDPSDEYTIGVLEGREVVFLPRHDKAHRLLPSEVNYRANIYGMKKLGVERIISISAVGSLRKELKPLDIMVPDQFVDRTNQARQMTFFGDGIAAHIPFAEPVCAQLSKVLIESGRAMGATIHEKGIYINMEGAAFSTKAESHLYKSWGMDVIGMTNMPEAKLAREAEICYATLACVTDYDCWYMDEAVESVTVDLIVQNLAKNVEMSKRILKEAIRRLPEKRACGCARALENAIVTARDKISPEVKRRLGLIIGKYIA